MTPIRTTMVGSWPIPFGQRLKLKEYYADLVTDQEAYSVLQAAARIAMDEQIACGVDQFMGGETFAPDVFHHTPPRLAGLETLQRRDTSKGHEGVGRYRVVGNLSAPRGTGHSLAFQREKAIEPRLSKVAIPSPLTIAGGFVNDSEIDHISDMSEIVAHEIVSMSRSGAEEIQLDAPSEAVAMISGSRSVDDLIPLIADPFSGIDTKGVGRKIIKTVHFCLGDISRKTATEEQNLRNLIPLVQALEGKVDRVHFECSYAGQWAEREVLGDIPDSIEVIAGIADVKNTSPSATVEDLSEKISLLLKVIPADRLLVSTSCGCGRVPHDEAIRLVRNLVKAAMQF